MLALNEKFLDELLKKELPDEQFEKSTSISQQKINDFMQVIKRIKLKQALKKDEQIYDKYECASINITPENICISDRKLYSILLLARSPYQAFLTLIKNITIEDCYTSVVNLSYGIVNDIDNLTVYLLKNIVLPEYRNEECLDELISASITIDEFSFYECINEKNFIKEHTYKKYQRIIYCIYFSIASRDKQTLTVSLMNDRLVVDNYWMINSKMVDEFIKEQNGKKLVSLLEKHIQLLSVKQIDRCMAKVLLIKNAKKSLYDKLEPILNPYKDNENVPHIDKFYSIRLMQELSEEETEFEY